MDDAQQRRKAYVDYLVALSAVHGRLRGLSRSGQSGARTPMTIAAVDPGELEELAGDIAEIFRAAFPDEPTASVWQRSSLAANAGRPGFRCVTATVDGRLVGFAYGWPGEAGRWWTERVRKALAARPGWMSDHFEFAELAVHPDRQRQGLGGALHDALLAGVPQRRALLSVARTNAPARALYRGRGWRQIGVLDNGFLILGLKRNGGSG